MRHRFEAIASPDTRRSRTGKSTRAGQVRAVQGSIGIRTSLLAGFVPERMTSISYGDEIQAPVNMDWALRR